MPTRREIIGTAMAFSAWPSLRPLAAAALPQTSREGAPDDETFWGYVRSEFELAPEFTNLVSVVRGNFTRANREIAFSEATRLNRLPAPFPDPDQDREIRRKTAGFIGAQPENIALLRNTTEGVTTVLANWPLKAGDEILTSSAEHRPFYGNTRPWLAAPHDCDLGFASRLRQSVSSRSLGEGFRLSLRTLEVLENLLSY